MTTPPNPLDKLRVDCAQLRLALVVAIRELEKRAYEEEEPLKTRIKRWRRLLERTR